MKKRNLESLREEEEERVRHLLLGESFLFEQNRAAATTVLLRSHAQRVSDLLKNEKGRVGVVGKAGRDGGGKLQAGSGKWLDDNKREFVKWNQNVSNLPRPVQTLQGFRRLALGTSRDPLPQVAAAAATMEVAMVVMLVVQYTMYLRPSEPCNQTVGQVTRPRQGTGASSWALLLSPLEETMASKRWNSTEALYWSATFSSRVDKTGSQSRVISKSRCRAKLHSIFKHAQRHSRDGRFFWLLGGSDQLVGNQIARLSLHLEW